MGLAAQIEREFISVRTKEALNRRKAEGLPLGRPKGPAKTVKLDFTTVHFLIEPIKKRKINNNAKVLLN